MEQNLVTDIETPVVPDLQNASEPVLRTKWLKIGLVSLLGLVLLIGVFYAGSKMGAQDELSKDFSSSTEVTSSTPSASSTQEIVTEVVVHDAPVNLADKYGFTETLDLSGIGITANFPQNATASLQEENFYVITAKNSDIVTFALKNYSGGGRRAWFQKNYPFAKEYAFEPFSGSDHSGYIAYAVLPKDSPGGFYYFSALSPDTMLVVAGSDNVEFQSVFYSQDLQRVKSFLSGITLSTRKKTALATTPQASDLYRWSSTRKTVWEDASLGLKITTPEWTESRVTGKRDANGAVTYSDWVKEYPSTTTLDTNYFTESIRQIVVTGGYGFNHYVSILPAKYQSKPFSDVANELLLPAGFCTTESKSSKSDCASADYCYTTAEVLQNLVVKKQVKIGALDAQLRSMNQDFSNKNDCRAEDTWLIKAKNGQYILSDISPENETFRLESF